LPAPVVPAGIRMTDSHEEGSLVPSTRVIDDELWERFMELTGGAGAACYQCGACTAACPWGLVREEPFSVRKLIHEAQLGLEDAGDSLWLCTACAECEATCPRQVPVAEIFRALRAMNWERRQTLKGLPSVLWSVYWNNNPWSQPPSQRARWASGIEIPTFDPERHEMLLYVGCTASYDRRAQRIARSLVKVLRAAGVSFGILGDDEPCCGEAVLSLGHRDYFCELSQNTARILRERGVRHMVTISPHAYDTFRNHYPGVDDAFRPMHYAEYLAELAAADRLHLPNRIDGRYTFHDPCLLGRRNGLYDAPRELLSSIPGVEMVEMEHHGPEALCCGGGGGRMWMETPIGQRFADIRIREATATGASTIVTACPFCIACLEDSLGSRKVRDVEVMDIAEILALAVQDEESKI
jgi:Fe-S oxidoreductase